MSRCIDVMKANDLHYLGNPSHLQLNLENGRLDNLFESYTGEDGYFSVTVALVRLGETKAHNIYIMGGTLNYFKTVNLPKLIEDVPSWDMIGLRFNGTPKVLIDTEPSDDV